MPYKNPADHAASQRRSYLRRKDKICEDQRARKRDRELKRAGGRPRPLVCDVCSQPSWRMTFDHCHATDKFRGWLCYGCNIALGHVKDSPETLRALADYLEFGLKTIKGNQSWPEAANDQAPDENQALPHLKLVR